MLAVSALALASVARANGTPEVKSYKAAKHHGGKGKWYDQNKWIGWQKKKHTPDEVAAAFFPKSTECKGPVQIVNTLGESAMEDRNDRRSAGGASTHACTKLPSHTMY